MIDIDKFVAWAESLGPTTVTGDEVKIRCPFCDDRKQHLWANPRKNCYQCWKCQRKGRCYELVRDISGTDVARSVCIYESRLVDSESLLREIYAKKQPPPPPKLDLPPDTFAISALAADSPYRRRAQEFLQRRHLGEGRLMVCVGGVYRDRLVIPYHGGDGQLLYWNTRDLSGRQGIQRYLGPPADVGIGKGDVIFMQRWPAAGTKVYLAEGEFDAMSLDRCGLNGAAAGGKALTAAQAVLLRPYQVCLCFDNDESGAAALHRGGMQLLRNGVHQVTYVRPGNPCKDWNDLVVRYGTEVTLQYVQDEERSFSPDVALQLEGRLA